VSTPPSRLWKDLPPDTRQAAALAFWQDESSADVEVHHAEAVMAIAKRLKFRPKSVQALPEERRARYLAQMSDVSDGVATRALIAYHFQTKRPLMSAFLDALGIAHEDGLITAESVPAPEGPALAAAAGRLRELFPEPDVLLYLRTLAALDSDTWVNLPPMAMGQ
jgi:hypothetical protein